MSKYLNIYDTNRDKILISLEINILDWKKECTRESYLTWIFKEIKIFKEWNFSWSFFFLLPSCIFTRFSTSTCGKFDVITKAVNFISFFRSSFKIIAVIWFNLSFLGKNFMPIFIFSEYFLFKFLSKTVSTENVFAFQILPYCLKKYSKITWNILSLTKSLEGGKGF